MNWKRLSLQILAAVLVVSAACVTCGRPPTAGAQPRGVILIISDALRADHLGCYGYSRETSPVIDGLAAKGVRFEHAYSSASWTTPSVASLFTSTYPSVHRAGHPGSGFGYSRSLPAGATTVAELLTSQGIRCIGVLNNPALAAGFGFGQGFEQYEFKERMRKGRPTVETASKVIAKLSELGDDRFFMVWHLLDPHWPYCPPDEHRVFVDPEYRGRFLRSFESADATPVVNGSRGLSDQELRHVVDLYDGEVRYTDQQVGRLVSAIGRLGLADDVMLVFTSDHGESFLEHGHFGHELPMYEENLRVPLIVVDPRHGPREVSRIVESIDVAPTILDLFGLSAPEVFQGQSLLPLISGETDAWREKPAYSEAGMFHERKALRMPGAKLVWSPAGIVLNDAFVSGKRNPPKYIQQAEKLYDFTGEGEARDVSRQRPQLVAGIRAEIASMVHANQARQLSDDSVFQCLTFDENWREDVFSSAGRVQCREGILGILDDPEAEVLWEIRFPRPVVRIDVGSGASCDKPIPFLSLSTDRERWHALEKPGAAQPGGAAVGGTFRFDGVRSVYLRFAPSEPARAFLKFIGIQAHFSDPLPEGGSLLRQELAALGYAE